MVSMEDSEHVLNLAKLSILHSCEGGNTIPVEDIVTYLLGKLEVSLRSDIERYIKEQGITK